MMIVSECVLEERMKRGLHVAKHCFTAPYEASKKNQADWAVFPGKPERQTFQRGERGALPSPGHLLSRISSSNYTFGPFPEASLLSGAE